MNFFTKKQGILSLCASFLLFPAGLGAAEIVVETPGTLSELVGDEKETMESLKVSGPINGDDIAFLREMMGTDMDGMFGGLEMKEDGKYWYTPIGCSLASLDLSEAQIVAGDAEYYSGKVTENDAVGDNMFEMCLNAKTILLPETSSVVGNFAFGSSMYLESMVIPDGVQSVGKSAFISCYSLKQVTFGAGVTSIGSDVFYQCSALESITFKSEAVPEIGNNAFADVPETCVIYVPTEAAKAAFAADPAFAGFTIEAESQGEVEIPSEIVMEAPGTLSSVIGGNKDLIERLKIIGPVDGADISFLREMMGTENWTLNPAPDENGWWWYVPQNGSLAYLDLSEAQIVAGDAEYYSGKVTENDVVGDNMFELCLNAKELLLPETASEIGAFAFGSSMYLESMDVPDGVKSIGDMAFMSCYSLKTVTVGQGVESIGMMAFNQCYGLESITFESETVPEMGDMALMQVPATCVIYVPTLAAKEAFEAEPAFAGYTIIAKDASVNEIAESGYEVVAVENGIRVDVDSSALVSVYTAGGSMVYSGMVDSGEFIELQTGFYIVRIGDEVKKVAVR